MPGTATAPGLAYAAYLAHEQTAESRHEFVGGEIFARAGGTRAHGLVQTGVIATLARLLTGKPCRPCGPDNRVYFPDYGDAAYPDAHVVCGRPERASVDPDAIVNPTVVVEVLSPTTEVWDRTGKFERFESLPSLREYVLVSVDRPRVELFRRSDGEPFTRMLKGAGEEVALESIDISFAVDELYRLLREDEAAEAE